MFERLSKPSPSTVLSFMAVVIALGGTAVAATATLIKITDNSGTRVAYVDSVARLHTSAAPAAGYSSFTTLAYATTTGNVILGPSQAFVAVSSLGVTNPYTQSNKAAATTTVSVGHATTPGGCTVASSTVVAKYDVQAGTSFQAVFPAGLVLKSTGPSDYWCLFAATAVEGNPGVQYHQRVVVNGFVESGSFVPPASATAAESTSGVRR